MKENNIYYAKQGNKKMKETIKEKILHKLGRGKNITVYPHDFVWVAVLGVIFIVTLELFFRMIVNFNGRYESDVLYYVVTKNVEMLPRERLLDFIFRFLYMINGITMEINIFLAFEIVAIVLVNYLVIRTFLKDDEYLNKVPRYAIQFFSVAMLFMGPIYVPVLHEWFYRKSFSSFAWHSPTQQAMTLFAMLSSLCFLKMYQRYNADGVSLVWWIATAVTTFLATASKPNYTISLSLAIVVMFVVELIKGGRHDIRNRFLKLFVMGLSVVPSGLFMIWLHTIEFTEGTQFGEEHKVVLGISHVLNYEHLWAAILFGMLFPIVVFALAPNKIMDTKYKFTFYIFLMGVVQWGLLSETGTRGAFGNFAWGRIYGTYFLTLAASVVALEMFFDRDKFFNSARKKTVSLFLLGIILLASVISQLVYFKLILTGHGYLR